MSVENLNTVVQTQTVVAAHFSSKQLLLFAFSEQSRHGRDCFKDQLQIIYSRVSSDYNLTQESYHLLKRIRA